MFRPYRAVLFAGLAVLATAASSSGQSSYHPATGIVDGGAGVAGPLSVMTYNVKGLPWPIATGREAAMARIAERLAVLRRAGRQPHIVLLQEAFISRAEQIAAHAGYAHVAVGPDADHPSTLPAEAGDAAYLAAARWDRGEGIGKQLGSGLLILSDYPIQSVDRMAFPDFACAGFDCLANKGVLIAHVLPPGGGRSISIVNTHLNARKAAGVPIDRSQRAFARQAALMARFVADHVPGAQPVVLGGDMNIGKDDRRHRAFFAAFAQAGLGFVAQASAGAHRALAQSACGDARTRNDLIRARHGAKDWLFARGADRAVMAIASAHVPFGSEPDGVPLSDHVGYVIDYDVHAPTRWAAQPIADNKL